MGLFGPKKNEMRISIPGMHCENCEKKVSAVLEEVHGIKSFKPSLKKHEVSITLDSESPASFDTIEEALTSGGYPPELQA